MLWRLTCCDVGSAGLDEQRRYEVIELVLEETLTGQQLKQKYSYVELDDSFQPLVSMAIICLAHRRCLHDGARGFRECPIRRHSHTTTQWQRAALHIVTFHQGVVVGRFKRDAVGASQAALDEHTGRSMAISIHMARPSNRDVLDVLLRTGCSARLHN
jgi:hypothetical protein